MHIPTSTYRIQFHSEFNFYHAKEIVAYLADLGVGDLYASPIFKAVEGSTHGYDVVDPTILNPELGTEEDFSTLTSELQQHQMGWLQDIVPNHMAYNSQNLWLMDVLEHGRDSEFFDFFDINWFPPYEEMNGRVLAPMLGDFYGRALERGEITLDYDKQNLIVDYFGLKLPVKIESYLTFITHNLGKLARELGRQHPDFIKFLGILYLLKSIADETKGQARYDQISFIKSLLWETYSHNSTVEEFIQSNLKEFNGEVGNPESFNLLDNLLNEQVYRLSFWKVGAEEINYRRFFTVNELISVKVEELRVFDRTHELIAKLVAENKFTGVRIDHIDGLYDPAEYLTRLREKLGGDTYITVEKILELSEKLPTSWQIQGTSGYESLNYINGLFCQLNNEAEFSNIYRHFTRLSANYDDLVYAKKSLILEKNLAGDLTNLTQMLKRISAHTRKGSDFTIYGLRKALFEVLVLFPVYRTYVDREGMTEVDRKYVRQSIKSAKKKVPLLVNELDFIQKILLLDYENFLSSEQQEEWLNFVMRSQQLTGPLMAKGVEDTLLYVYNRLLSLNEVGGNPSHFGIELDLFHQFNQHKVEEWQHGMNTTATHDTKRGEDVRARINVLSEIPQEWSEQVNKWQEINQAYKQDGFPDANDEYFLYQTLLGTYPLETDELADFCDRIKDYVLKAVREAKVHTAWLHPDEAYEQAYLSFIDRIFEDKNSDFWQHFQPFQERIAEYGIYNSLSQVLIKNTIPGVPDLYQGAELWELSLVDPDNRRPVDYQKRSDFLQDIKAKSTQDIQSLLEELMATKANGKIKLFLTHKLLKARQEYSEIFLNGDYQPIEITGKYRHNLIAFSRNYQSKTVVAIAPRFLTTVIKPEQSPLSIEVWSDTSLKLPAKNWQNAIDDRTIAGDNVAVGEILQNFPVALLVGQ